MFGEYRKKQGWGTPRRPKGGVGTKGGGYDSNWVNSITWVTTKKGVKNFFG